MNSNSYPFLIILVILFFNIEGAFGQSNSGMTFRIKNSISFRYYKELNVERFELTKTTKYTSNQILELDFLNPSFEFITKNRNSHEIVFQNIFVQKNNYNRSIELINQGINESAAIFETRKILIDLSYIYNYRLNNNKSIFEFYLGFGTNSKIDLTRMGSSSLSVFPVSFRDYNNFILSFFINPKINYNISDKCYLEASLPIAFFTHTRISNPVIFNSQNPIIGKISYYEYSFFPPQFIFNLSFGIKL